MEWITGLLQAHPELAIYLTLGLLPQTIFVKACHIVVISTKTKTSFISNTLE